MPSYEDWLEFSKRTILGFAALLNLDPSLAEELGSPLIVENDGILRLVGRYGEVFLEPAIGGCRGGADARIRYALGDGPEVLVNGARCPIYLDHNRTQRELIEAVKVAIAGHHAPA